MFLFNGYLCFNVFDRVNFIVGFLGSSESCYKERHIKESHQLFDLRELILKVTYPYRSSMKTCKYFRDRLC